MQNIQRHFVNMMTSPSFCLILSSFMLILFVAYARCTHNPNDIQRAGGIISMLGLFPVTRSLLRKGVSETYLSLIGIDGGEYGDLNKEKLQEQKKTEELKDVKAQRYGFWFIFIGTWIWAFGDIVYIEILKKLGVSF